MTKGMAAMLVYTTKNVIATLLLLYTNMAAMTSHANQEFILSCTNTSLCNGGVVSSRSEILKSTTNFNKKLILISTLIFFLNYYYFFLHFTVLESNYKGNRIPRTIAGLHSIPRTQMTKGVAAILVYTTKENCYSVVIVHQLGGYDVTCKPRIV